MRVKNSYKNVAVGLLSQLILIVFAFITRKIFMDNLGAEYAGINKVLGDLLLWLGLIEGGIGSSIIYNLYKPLADNDTEKVTALVQLYQKLYRILALVMVLISLCLYPLIPLITRNSQELTDSYIAIVYFIFIAQNVVTYLYAHKYSLINADQKGYRLAKVNLFFQIMVGIAKILILIYWQSYIAFLLVSIAFTLIQNTINGRIVDKYYPYIKTKEKLQVDAKTKANLITNVKAIFLHRIGTYTVAATDSVVLTNYLGLRISGYVSNYTLLTTQIALFLGMVFNGIGSSVAHLIATEDEDKSYFIFKTISLLNYFICSAGTVCTYVLTEPFIGHLWLDETNLLHHAVLITILINFYLTSMRASILTFKQKSGIFAQDKYMPLLEAIINLIISIYLVQKIGIPGVFIGTIISLLAIPLWNQPRLVFKYVFKRSVIPYLIQFCLQAGLVAIMAWLARAICHQLFEIGNLLFMVISGIICLLLVFLINIAIYHRTDEFKYIADLVKKLAIRRGLLKLKRKR